MHIRRIVLAAVALAAVAVPVTAGVASALPPNGFSIFVVGTGSSPAAAKADATNKLAQVAGQDGASSCFGASYFTPSFSDGAYKQPASENCVR